MLFPKKLVASRECAPLTIEVVGNTVRGFPSGSAGGLDGLKPQHLEDLLAASNREIADELCSVLQNAENMMLNGCLSENILPLLYGASLTPLVKKDGRIRPIAAGGVFRSMVAEIVSRRVQDKAGLFLRPEQLGCGTKGGCEAADQAARNFLSLPPFSCQVFLKLDFCNAFNSIHRQKVLDACQNFMPEYALFV